MTTTPRLTLRRYDQPKWTADGSCAGGGLQRLPVPAPIRTLEPTDAWRRKVPRKHERTVALSVVKQFLSGRDGHRTVTVAAADPISLVNFMR